MAFNLGVNVVEVDGRAAPTIVAAPTSVAGFLIRSQRGIPNVPVALKGFTDYTNFFGSYATGSNNQPLYGAHTIRGFFDSGGTDAYAVRIVGSGHRAANVILNDRLGTATLDVQAGMRGQPDPGVWGDALSVSIVDNSRGTAAVPAQIRGTIAEPFALVDGQSLQVIVNGESPPVTVTFAAADFVDIGSASAAEVVAVISRQTTALRVGITPELELMLASAIAGSASHLSVAGDAAAALGFDGAPSTSEGALVGTTTLAILQNTAGFLPGSAARLETRGHVIAPSAAATSGLVDTGIEVSIDGEPANVIAFTASDFLDADNIMPTEIVAAINRQAQGFTAALDHTQHLVLLSSSYGSGSSIAIAPPPVSPADAIGLLGFDTVTNPPVAGQQDYRALTMVSEVYKFVTWTPALGLPANFARIQSVEFDVIVNQNGVEVERFEALSMQPSLDYAIEAVVNNAISGSRYITVTNQNSGSGVGQTAPAQGVFELGSTPATAGNNGGEPVDTDYTGDPALRTGLYAFDMVNIQLLACPETQSAGVAIASLAYCERRGDAMFVGTAPRGYDLEGIKTYASELRASKVYGSLYAPWIQIANPTNTAGINPRLEIPPDGHVLGTYARIARSRGVWKAPAGDEAQLSNVLGVEFDMSDVDHTDLVKNGGVNGIRAIPRRGIVLDASRTLSTDTRWLYVGTRRLFNFAKKSLADGIPWALQEPNNQTLWNQINYNVITPFLTGLWRQGAFGSDPLEQVVTVKIDAENNPPDQVAQGNLTVEVYFYPVRPAETIILVIGQQEGSAIATES